jgi:hypothetical protein
MNRQVQGAAAFTIFQTKPWPVFWGAGEMAALPRGDARGDGFNL